MDPKAAIIPVLQQAGVALHGKEIAEQIMAAGLWQSDGKTPEAAGSAWPYYYHRSFTTSLRKASRNDRDSKLGGFLQSCLSFFRIMHLCRPAYMD